MKIDGVFYKENSTLGDVLEDLAFIVSSSKYSRNFSMKGMFVLSSALRGNIAEEKIIGTRDIDMDVDNRDVWLDFVANATELFNENTRLQGFYETITDMALRESGESGKLKIQFTTNNDEIHKTHIDMNIRELGPQTKFILPNLEFTATSLVVSLCDKIAVVSDAKMIQRRLKDLYHLYLMSSIMQFSVVNFLSVWNKRGRKFMSPPAILQGDIISAIEEQYNTRFAMRDIVSFQEVYTQAIRFIDPLLVVLSGVRDTTHLRWDKEKGWMS